MIKLSFFITNLYFLIAWLLHIISPLQKESENNPFHYYFLGVLLATCIFSFKSLKKIDFYSLKFFVEDNFSRFFFFIITLFFIFTRIYFFPKMPVWVDEYIQFIVGSEFGNGAIIKSALQQQQPPLDYILSSFSSRIWDSNSFAVKFNSLLFNFLFILQTPFLLYKVKKDKISSWLVTLFISTLAPTIIFSLEGRPLSLALLTSQYFTYFLIDYFKDGKNLSLLVSSQCIFLLSTGLQPQLLIFLMIIGLSIVSFKFKEFKKSKMLFLSGFFALIVHLPLLIGLWRSTEKTHQFTPLFSNLNFDLLINEIINNVKKVLYLDFYQISVVLLLAILLTIVFYKRKNWFALFLTICPINFILFYISIYTFFISWDFSARYVLCFLTILCFPVFYIIQFIKEIKNRTLRSALSILFLISPVLSTIHLFNKPFYETFHYTIRPDWENLYNYLNEELDDGDIIIRLGLNYLGSYRNHIPINNHIYGNSHVIDSSLDMHIVNYGTKSATIHFDDDFNYDSNGGDIYILSVPFHTPKPFKNLKTPGVSEVIKMRGLSIYKLPVENSFLKTYLSFLENLTKKYKNAEALAGVYETILYLKLKYDYPREEIKKDIQEFSQLNLNHHQTINGLSFNKEKLLAERINYFEKLLEEK